MAYDPDAHQRLDELSKKYCSWFLSQVRSDHEVGQPVLNADGIESSLSACYEDAVVTVQALYAYLVENPIPDHGSPRREAIPRPFLHAVDVLDDADDSTG